MRFLYLLAFFASEVTVTVTARSPNGLEFDALTVFLDIFFACEEGESSGFLHQRSVFKPKIIYNNLIML